MEGTEKTLGSAGLFRSWLGQALNGHLAAAPLVRAAVFVVAFSASAFAACTGSATVRLPPMSARVRTGGCFGRVPPNKHQVDHRYHQHPGWI